jgi:trimethylamine--corrinoid protein Co-methyltransferase
MSDEVISMVKRIMRGILVDEEHLAVDVINGVGPGGHYLADEHTYTHFKSEFWFPQLVDRLRWDEWQQAGSKTMARRVREKVIDLLENYEPDPLPDKVLEEVKGIIAQADERHKHEEDVSLL